MTSLLSSLLSPRLMRPLFWLMAAFSLTMALLPKPPSLPIDRFGDKFEHMLAFAALSGVASFAWPKLDWLRLAIPLSLFGVAIELFQMIPSLHRDADWRDWAADTIAIVAALLIARLFRQLLGGLYRS